MADEKLQNSKGSHEHAAKAHHAPGGDRGSETSF